MQERLQKLVETHDVTKDVHSIMQQYHEALHHEDEYREELIEVAKSILHDIFGIQSEVLNKIDITRYAKEVMIPESYFAGKDEKGKAEQEKYINQLSEADQQIIRDEQQCRQIINAIIT